MKKTMLALATIGALAITLVSASSATAAQTRELPAGETLYHIDCSVTSTVGSIYQVDPVTNVATLLGTPTTQADNPNIDCAGPAAYNPVNGKAYWISWHSSVSSLMEADLTTGKSNEIGTFTVVNIDGTTRNMDANSMAIDALGTAFVIENSDPNQTFTGDKLYSLDLSTARLTYLSDIQGIASSGNCVWSFAYNPADENFYINCSADGEIRMLNVTNGSTSVACTLNNGIYGLAFDSKGIGYVPDMRDPDTGVWVSGTIDITQPSCAPEFAGSYALVSVLGNEGYSESAFVKYAATAPVPPPAPPQTEPTLANTGAGASIAPFASALAVLVGVGLVSIAVRRRIS